MQESNRPEVDSQLLQELAEQDFDGVAGACSFNGFTLSKRLGNKGRVCTLTVECQKICG